MALTVIEFVSRLCAWCRDLVSGSVYSEYFNSASSSIGQTRSNSKWSESFHFLAGVAFLTVQPVLSPAIALRSMHERGTELVVSGHSGALFYGVYK